jgi:hypothetical protein
MLLSLFGVLSAVNPLMLCNKSCNDMQYASSGVTSQVFGTCRIHSSVLCGLNFNVRLNVVTGKT